MTKTKIENTLKDLGINIKDGNILENIDSLQLVELVLELEDRFNLSESLIADNAFSPSKSPFRTVETLADYIQSRLVP